jgi:predicted Zn-dependent protease
MLNMRAWIRATATDPGLRDGPQAIADATEAYKAKNDAPEYLDTLAVAYAETGDFNSANRFEEEALHIGGTSNEITKQLREHLAAFKQHRPIRDNAWK